MPKGRKNWKGAPGKRTVTPRPMNKPAMMDWALRLLRLLNERKVLNSRIVAEEFDVNIRTAQRYLLYLSDLPCVVVDEEKHTYTLTSDYVITDKILNTSEMALVCALIDYATHIFGKEHSKFLAGLKTGYSGSPTSTRSSRTMRSTWRRWPASNWRWNGTSRPAR
ncbi:MAG: hypothetical protein ACYDAX_04725 [Desulfobacteria bacterium]